MDGRTIPLLSRLRALSLTAKALGLDDVVVSLGDKSWRRLNLDLSRYVTRSNSTFERYEMSKEEHPNYYKFLEMPVVRVLELTDVSEASE